MLPACQVMLTRSRARPACICWGQKCVFLQHSCVLKCTTKPRIAGNIMLLEGAGKERVLGSTEGGSAQQKPYNGGCFPLDAGLREPVVKDRLRRSYPIHPIPLCEERGTVLFKWLLLFHSCIQDCAHIVPKQIHQSVPVPVRQFKRAEFGSGSSNSNCWTNVSHILSCS